MNSTRFDDDVWLDCVGPKERRIGPFDRKVHARECRDGLGLPVLHDDEIVFRQIADEVALGVGHDRVEFDVIDLDLEGDGRLLGSGLAGKRKRQRGRR